MKKSIPKKILLNNYVFYLFYIAFTYYKILNIEDKFSEFNISDKIDFCLRDNANNITAAMDYMKKESFGCLAHSLQLIIKTSILNAKEIEFVLN